ncbi:T9SS sorting signal type C domain-containing protein [Flavobacterium sp. MC2016-06]|jgi:hypothetical protein|uniref:T9SS sorting signal type C domain-containing protein n=1 Tax=Flavobacterium sp. MC2016-06 TaxID=2676308 RepID=UPI0012BA9819|nr:T9SS sorting signal type C domain-containing protein [Flavobacterium sp. MC2016-06]MBU3861369.1 T9SS sorting signal type C domain-containing protein [Flavobacterium sp. MC2016-06]
MKKTLLLFLLLPFFGFAQTTFSAGTYYINSTSSTTYLKSLSSAITELNKSGSSITGPVVFSLDESQSLSSQITINPIVGSSTANTLTIKPTDAVTNLTISGNIASGAVIALNGADNIIIDGNNNLKIYNTFNTTNSNTARLGIWLYNNSDNNIIQNLNIELNIAGLTTEASSTGVMAGSSTIGGNGNNINNTIQNVTFTKVKQAIVIKGQNLSNTGWKILNNKIESTDDNTKAYLGIYLLNTATYTITGNSLNGIKLPSGIGGSPTHSAIYLENANDGIISKNIISNIENLRGTYSGYGIYVSGNNPTISENTISNVNTNSTTTGAFGIRAEGNNTTLYNNKVSTIISSQAKSTAGIYTSGNNQLLYNNYVNNVASTGGGDAATQDGFGIYINSGATIKLYHNSVKLTTNQASGSSAALYLNSGSDFDIRNNIFVNTQTSGSLRFAIFSLEGDASKFTNINNNDYYSTQHIGCFGSYYTTSNRKTTLALWQSATGKDGASLNVNPLFTNSTLDLDTTDASNKTLAGTTTLLTTITSDIYNSARVKPYMGAYEIVSCLSPSITTQPTSPAAVCTGTGTQTITVAATGTGLTYVWKKDGTAVANGGVISGQGTNSLTLTSPTATNAGSYTVEITGACTPVVTSNAVTVTVNANNTFGAASSTPNVCINTAITAVTLTTVGATGISNSGVSGANGLPAGVSAAWASNQITISGTPTASGTFTYSIPLTGGCGSVNATGSITVNSQSTAPTGITGTTTICNGSSTTLTVAGGSLGTGATVQWFTGSCGGTSAGTGNSITVSPTTNTIYYVRYSGTCNTTTCANVTVNVTPTNTVTTASSTPNVCINTAITAVTLTSVGATGISNDGVSGANGLPAGVSATWASNQITISGTPTASGTFTYSIPLTGGCGSVNAAGTITVNPIVTPSVTITSTPSGTVCQGTNITFNAFVTNGGTTTTYKWYRNTTLITNQTGSAFNINDLENGDIVKVIITSNAACATTTTATSNEIQPSITMTDRGRTQGGGTICKGTATPLMKLVNYYGPGNVPYTETSKILYWEYSDDNNNTWTQIPGTANLNQYQPPETLTANRAYRAQAQTPGCNKLFAAIETTVIIKPLPTVTFTAQPGTETCKNTNVTYTTQASQFTYLWTVPGTVNVDYTIVSGSLATTSNTVTLKWLTAGSKTVTVNYKNSYSTNGSGVPNNDGCYATTPASAATTVTAPLSAPTQGTIVVPTCTVPTGSITLNSLAGSGTLAYQGPNSSTNSYTITGNSMTIPGLTPGDYTFSVSNSCGTVYSATITLQGANKWNGTAWSSGAEPTTDDILEFDSDYSLNKDINGCSCTVTNNAKVTIASGKTLNIINAVNVVSGSLTFENSASLVQKNNVTNTGNINYKRNITVRRLDLTYWSSPVTATPGFTMHDLSPNTLLDKYYTWVQATGWTVNLNGTLVMTQGKGYSIRAPQPYDTATPALYTGTFIGVPNNGNISYTPEAASWNLIGNPYPSALNANKLMNANANLGSLYFWTHNSSPTALPGETLYKYASADFAVYNLTGATASSTGGPVPSGYIGAGQAFFAKVSTGDPINFTNTMREIGTNQQFYKTTESSDTDVKSRVWLNFTNTQGAYKQVIIGYLNGATNYWDMNYDAATMNGNSYVDFYSINDSRKLTIQGRAMPFDNTETLPLGYKTTVAGDFTVAIDHVDGLFTDQAVYLEDKVTGKITDLRASNYTFTSEIGTFAERLVLRYTNKTLGTGDFDDLESTILVSVKDKVIKLTSSKESIKGVVIYDINGKLLYDNKKIDSTEFQLSNLQSSNQVLLVTVTLDNDFTTTKKIIFQ